MSALTDRDEYQTADNHRVIACECRGWDEWCECHPGARFIVRQNHAHTCQRHSHQEDRRIATVTEAAVREHIAAALDDLARARHDDLKETKRRTRAETFAGASAMAYELAARIARGEQ